MFKRFAALFALPLVASASPLRGWTQKRRQDDWEEINFEFNSSVLVDGFPSLLRLAELLQKNPGYKVKVEGHTDRHRRRPATTTNSAWRAPIRCATSW